MESKIFAKLNFDPGILVIGSLIATIVLIVLVLMLLLRQSRLEVNYKIFMRGRGGRSLQEVFKQELEGLDVIKEQTDLLHRRLSYVENSMNRSFQKCGIVRYDAFKEMGGQLSFAIALLNDSNTGFIINSIHSRDGSYSYIKDILRGECAIELCDEEKEALKIALEAAGSNPSMTRTERKRKKSAISSAAASGETGSEKIKLPHLPGSKRTGISDTKDTESRLEMEETADHTAKRTRRRRSSSVKGTVISSEQKQEKIS